MDLSRGVLRWAVLSVLSWFGPVRLSEDNETCWYRYGKLHRDGDLPALIRSDGSMEWYKNGQHHRDGDLPAIISSDGSMCWYQNGGLYRDGDLPAAIYNINNMTCHGWYRNGKPHRDGDLPAIIWSDGYQFWYRNGKLHRDGGRPAEISATGHYRWWFEGFEVTEEEARCIANRIKRHRLRISWFILDRLLPRLYDPYTAAGQRRMNRSYEDLHRAPMLVGPS